MFLLAGCAGTPGEVRYDETTIQYSVKKNDGTDEYITAPDKQRYRLGQNAMATAEYNHNMNSGSDEYNTSKEKNRYTIGQYDDATAHYRYLKGQRSTFSPDGSDTDTSSVGGDERSAAERMAGTTIVLDITDILFDFDKSVIKSAFLPELDKWVEFFMENPEVTAEIHGHADSTGPEKYNQGLSERRAQAVVNYLVTNGVEAARLTATGFGEMVPVAPNTSKEGRQKNRRVEMNF